MFRDVRLVIRDGHTVTNTQHVQQVQVAVVLSKDIVYYRVADPLGVWVWAGGGGGGPAHDVGFSKLGPKAAPTLFSRLDPPPSYLGL